MTATLYPVAETAEAALHAPRGYAEREREAQAVAADAVVFVSELVGPAFATREAALEAYGRRLDPAHAGMAAGAEGRWRQLVPVSASPGEPVPIQPALRPTYRNGHRWPRAPDAAVILWRLSISYWRIGEASSLTPGALEQDAAVAPVEAARRLRRGVAGRELGAPVLNALARQPLRPFKLQQPLDIGLFEMHPPEAPDTVIPDE